MDTVLQNAIDALSLGGLYALLALGIAVIYGIMQLINFAHGELIMIGAYALFLFSAEPLLMVVAAATAVTIAAAIGMERIAFRPVRKADPSTLLITSFAVSFMLQSLAITIFGARPKSVSLTPLATEQIAIGDIRIAKLSIFTILLTGVLLAALALFLKRTPLGIQMRAAAEDFEMARLLGVRANRVIAAAFAISGLLAAVAAILLVAQSGTLSPTMGLTPVIIAFVATIMGGMGSLKGAAVGGAILGTLTVTLQVVLPLELRPYRDAFLFSAVILVFLFRPQGLVVSAGTQERV